MSISLCVHAEWSGRANTSTIQMKLNSIIPSLKIQTGRGQNAANRVAESVKLSLR